MNQFTKTLASGYTTRPKLPTEWMKTLERQQRRKGELHIYALQNIIYFSLGVTLRYCGVLGLWAECRLKSTSGGTFNLLPRLS
jgi:hypothetical protein